MRPAFGGLFSNQKSVPNRKSASGFPWWFIHAARPPARPPPRSPSPLPRPLCRRWRLARSGCPTRARVGALPLLRARGPGRGVAGGGLVRPSLWSVVVAALRWPLPLRAAALCPAPAPFGARVCARGRSHRPPSFARGALRASLRPPAR